MQKKVRIRTKIFLIVLVAIVPTVVITFYSAEKFRKTYIRERSTFISNLCEGFLNEQRLIIRNGEEMLIAISRTRAVLDHDYPRLNAYLRDLMETYHNYAVLVVADGTGLIVASGINRTGYSVADRAYFQLVLRTNKFSIGGFNVSKSTGRPSLILAYPVRDNDGNTLVLIASFDLDNYYKELSLGRLAGDCCLEIFDENGRRLFTSLPGEKYATGNPVMPELFDLAAKNGSGGAPGAAAGVSLGGKEYLVSTGSLVVNERRVFATIRIPWDQVNREAGEPANRMYAFMFLAVCLALFLSVMLARVLFVGRIEKLTSHTKLLADGQLDIRFDLNRTSDEITDLMESFNTMAENLDERNRTNERAIAEKEHLLQELRQRISDNLQLLSSMVNLQIEHTVDMNVRHALMTTHSRVMALALVYETIYRYSDVQRVDMQHYGGGLCEFLVTLYADIGANLSCTVSGDDVSLPIGKALPIALILNELVSNSIKHAFSPGLPGTIVIVFSKSPNGNIFLDISDNGTGFEGGIHKSDTLGFEMIEALVEQIFGSFSIESNSGGTRVRIHFQNLE